MGTFEKGGDFPEHVRVRLGGESREWNTGPQTANSIAYFIDKCNLYLLIDWPTLLAGIDDSAAD